MIDPSFWEDPTIGQLSIAGRLLFVGMVSHADDDGRLEVDPRYIRRAVFGFDDDVTTAQVVSLLAEVRTTCRNVIFYEVDGRALACFTNWKRYQYIQKHQDSKLPPPPDDTDNIGLSAQYDTDTIPVAPNRIEVNRIEERGSDTGATTPAPDPSPVVQKSPSKERDPLLDHPAVVSYREALHITPVAAQREAIAAVVTDIELWRSTIHNWRLSNNKPSNVLGLLDWYKNGGRPFPARNGAPNGNGKPSDPRPRLPNGEIDYEAWDRMIASDPGFYVRGR